MKLLTIFKIALGVSVALLIYSLIIIFSSGISSAGPFLILFLLFLGIASRGFESLKGFTYSLMIFTGVACALYYPEYFIEVNGFKLAALITPLIQIIMFGMGTSMSVNDFVGVIKMPKGVAIGTVAHFIIMPLVGFTLASISNFPPEIAAGMILIGCSPCGLASNVMSYLAKANLALSITLTTVSTLLAPFLTPMLMKFLAGTYIEIDIMKMMWDIFKMIVIPIGAGLLFNKLFHGKSKWLDLAMPLVSMIGIGLIITIITASGRDSLLDIGLILTVLVLIHNLTGYLLGYWVARLFKMNERDSRTVALEVGMQNAGLAAGLAKEMGKMATVGLAPAVFGPIMNITGSILASYWHRKPPKEN
jgi:bile acid:Na+ symporter, BASS family